MDARTQTLRSVDKCFADLSVLEVAGGLDIIPICVLKVVSPMYIPAIEVSHLYGCCSAAS